MNRKGSVLFYALFAALAFFPVGTVLTYCFGYRLVLFQYTICSAILAIVCVVCVTLLLLNKTYIPTKVQKVLIWFLPLLALANWGLYIFQADSVIAFVCMLVCFISTLVISIQNIKFTVLRAIGITLSVLLIPPLSFVSLFASLGKNTVVSTIPSPDGKRYVEVVDSDQGALGGDTIVYLYENAGFDAFVFSIEKPPQTIYIGQWGEYKTMPVYWIDNGCLIVHSTPYQID